MRQGLLDERRLFDRLSSAILCPCLEKEGFSDKGVRASKIVLRWSRCPQWLDTGQSVNDVALHRWHHAPAGERASEEGTLSIFGAAQERDLQFILEGITCCL